MRKTIDDFILRLPDNYAKKDDKNSNLYKFLHLSGTELDQIKEMSQKLSQVTLIDKAEGKNLDRIGENVQQQRGYLADRIYRVLLKARIKINRSNCTINEIIEILATIFNIEKSEVEVKEPEWGSFRFAKDENTPDYEGFGFDNGKLAILADDFARIMIAIPPQALNGIGFSRQWFTELLKEISAAGVSADLLYRGSFAFATESNQPDYNDKEAGFDRGVLGAYFEPASSRRLPLAK